MSWEIIIIAACLLIAILMGIFWKNPYVNKYRKCALILIPFLFVAIIKLIVDIKNRGNRASSTGGIKPEELRNSIDSIRNQIEEVQLETAIKVSAAKEKNSEKIRQLEEIKTIPDNMERLKRLAELVG